MHFFSGKSYEELYLKALILCRSNKQTIKSRVGDVSDLGPVSFEIDGHELGLISLPGRAVNPFFAFTELAWVIEGRNELTTLEYFISNYGKYSDDGKTLNGAYGYRMLSRYGVNQLEKVIEELKFNPNTRRAVITLHTPEDLNNIESRDIPCNISLLFKIRNNRLDITVFNRSNDVFLGIPYNFLLFRFLQYYVSKKVHVPLGVHRHITDSLHLYTRDTEKVDKLIEKNINPSFEHEMSFLIFDKLIQDSKYICSLEFDMISDQSLKSFYNAYHRFKLNSDASVFDKIDESLGLRLVIQNWIDVHHAGRG